MSEAPANIPLPAASASAAAAAPMQAAAAAPATATMGLPLETLAAGGAQPPLPGLSSKGHFYPCNPHLRDPSQPPAHIRKPKPKCWRSVRRLRPGAQVTAASGEVINFDAEGATRAARARLAGH